MRATELALPVVVAIIAIATGAALYGMLSDGDFEPDFEYLDVVPLSDFDDPDEMTGCCEVVEYQGVPYVRMTGVGKISAIHGSETETYTVGKAHLDLFLFTGQSNSCSYTSPDYYEDDSPLPPGVAFYLGTPEVYSASLGRGANALARTATLEESEFVDIAAPDGSVRVAGSYPALMSKYWQTTGHRMLVVNSGISARSIESFYSMTGNCSVWTMDVLNKTSELAEGTCVLEPIAVLWSQGESDKDQATDWYKTRLATVVDRFCDGTYGVSFPAVLSTLPKYYGVASPINPAIAQTEYAAEDSHFIVASSLPTVLPDKVSGRSNDGLHYNQKVYDWMGEAFANAASRYVQGIPTSESIAYSPNLGKVSSLPNIVTAYVVSGRPFQVPIAWEDVPDEPGSYTVHGKIWPPHLKNELYHLDVTAVITVS